MHPIAVVVQRHLYYRHRGFIVIEKQRGLVLRVSWNFSSPTTTSAVTSAILCCFRASMTYMMMRTVVDLSPAIDAANADAAAAVV